LTWQWACLACNETWSSTSPAAHACAQPLEGLRAFWTHRLRWAPNLHDKPEAQIRALVSRPINRALLVVLLGASWDPAGDDGARLPINSPRELAQ
jgi:hypothetical protein